MIDNETLNDDYQQLALAWMRYMFPLWVEANETVSAASQCAKFVEGVLDAKATYIERIGGVNE